MRGLYISLVAITLLPGCDSLFKVPIDPDRVVVVPTRGGVPGPDPSDPTKPAPAAPAARVTDIQRMALAQLYLDARSAPTDQAATAKFLRAGMALSDDLCATWFQSLGKAQVLTNAKKDLTENAGTMIAVLLGVTSAGTAAVTSVAAGTTFLSKSYDSESANFIVAPDVGVVQRAIDVNRSGSADDINAQLDRGAINNVDDAYRILIRYDYTCSHNEVKRIVNESVARNSNARQTTDTNGNQPKSDLFNALLAATAPQIKQLLPDATFDAAAAEALYAKLVAFDKLTDAASKRFQQVLTDKGIIDKSGNLKISSAVKTDDDKKAALARLTKLVANLNATGELETQLKAEAALK